MSLNVVYLLVLSWCISRCYSVLILTNYSSFHLQFHVKEISLLTAASFCTPFLPPDHRQQHGKRLGADGHWGDQVRHLGVRHHHDADLPSNSATLEAKATSTASEGKFPSTVKVRNEATAGANSNQQNDCCIQPL